MTYSVDDRKLYNQAYFTQREYAVDQKRQQMYEQEQARINAISTKIRGKLGGELLDVGCGVGSFLVSMDDRWKKHGIEPSRYASEKAQEMGIIMHDDFTSIEDKSFDMVIFRGTLQHIADPVGALAQASRVLKPGGMLVVLATPDADSLVYKIWGNLPALDAPRNWCVLGSTNLRNILELRFGYSVALIKHPYMGTPYAQPVKDFANFVFSLFFGWRKFAFPGNMMEVYAVK